MAIGDTERTAVKEQVEDAFNELYRQVQGNFPEVDDGDLGSGGGIYHQSNGGDVLIDSVVDHFFGYFLYEQRNEMKGGE
jgi:hypothetical protein